LIKIKIRYIYRDKKLINPNKNIKQNKNHIFNYNKKKISQRTIGGTAINHDVLSFNFLQIESYQN